MYRVTAITKAKTLDALERNKWDKKKAAEELNIHITTLYRRLKIWNIDIKEINQKYETEKPLPRGRFVLMARGGQGYKRARAEFCRVRDQLISAFACTTLAREIMLDAKNGAPEWIDDDDYKLEGIRYAQHNIAMSIGVIDVVLDRYPSTVARQIRPGGKKGGKE